MLRVAIVFCCHCLLADVEMKPLSNFMQQATVNAAAQCKTVVVPRQLGAA